MAEARFSEGDASVQPIQNDQQLEEEMGEDNLALLEAIAELMAEHRSMAVRGRRELGIADEWYEDQEFYEGIDDANRAEQGRYRSKPTSGGQTDQTSEEQEDGTSSIVFPNITQPYCDGMSAQVGDMLLPSDDKGWAITPTPIADLISFKEGMPKASELDAITKKYENELAGSDENVKAQAQADIDAEIVELFRSKMPKSITGPLEAETAERNPQLDESGLSNMVATNYQDLVKNVQDEDAEAMRSARAAEKRIQDWLVECQYQGEVRKAIDKASQIGTGVMKGPVPMRSKTIGYKDGQLVIQNKLVPQSFEVNVFNCFPDPECGESIHDGSFHWERDRMTRKRVQGLIGQPGFITPMIYRVLQEGPWVVADVVQEGEVEAGFETLQKQIDRSHTFEIWYGYDYIEMQDARAIGLELDKNLHDLDLVPVHVVMINNHIVKIELNLLDTGEFPYDYAVLKKRSGLPYGTGIARQLRTCQRIVTAALRNMMDNAGLAGGPMWAYLEGVIEPLDGKYELRPRKGWAVDIDDLKGNDFRLLEKAFQYIDMDMKQSELTEIIQLALKLAEDVTGMPMIMQGQQGSAPETVGGMNILNNNASTILRRIARLFDDQLTEPHIRRYYTYLLQYGESDDEKGDFQIQARGSTSLVERALNDSSIAEMKVIVDDPTYGLDKKKWAVQYLKSKRLHAADFTFDDEDWEEVLEGLMAQAEAGDPRVEVAQMNNQTKLELQQMVNALKEAEMALELQKQQTDIAVQGERDRTDRELQQAFKALELETANLDRDADMTKVVETLKGKIAETAMKLEAQLKMQRESGESAQVTTPPTEPPGRAAPGQAYAQ